MSDSSVYVSSLPSTPKGAQAEPRAISLLSLPIELLALIGHQLAGPEGGGAVAALRLASSLLAKILQPILFKCIHVTADSEESDALLAALAWNVGGVKAFVQRVRWDVSAEPLALSAHAIATLPNLQHLDLRGETPPLDDDGVLRQSPLPASIAFVLSRIPTLHSLHLENLEVTDRRSIHKWAPTVRILSLNDCLGSSRPFFGQTRLESASLLLPQKEAKLIQSFRALAFLEGALPTVSSIVLRWTKITARDANYDPLYELDPTTLPIKSLHFLGTPALFTSSPPTGHASSVFLELLNFIGRTGIEELSLRLRPTFVYDPLWATLSLPSLKRLELACQTSPDLSDVLNQATYNSLLSLLSSFPGLASLHLRGWLDQTGVEIALLTQAERAARSLCTTGLLAFLADSKVVELRFSFSEGYRDFSAKSHHPHATERRECVFERRSPQDGEWKGRIAVFI